MINCDNCDNISGNSRELIFYYHPTLVQIHKYEIVYNIYDMCDQFFCQ